MIVQQHMIIINSLVFSFMRACDEENKSTDKIYWTLNFIDIHINEINYM